MKDVRTTEMSYYMNKMQAFGLPLDSRGNYCKNDWQMWTMGFADLESQRTKLINTLWKYINETTSRVPVSDNHDVLSGRQAMFQARSVVGGYWMRVFVEKTQGNLLTGINNSLIPNNPNPSRNGGEIFDLSGRKMLNGQSSMFNGLRKGIYIVNGKKVMAK